MKQPKFKTTEAKQNLKSSDKVKITSYIHDMLWDKDTIGQTVEFQFISADGYYVMDNCYGYHPDEFEIVESKGAKTNFTPSSSEFTQAELQSMQELFKINIKNVQIMKKSAKEDCAYWWNHSIKDSPGSAYSFNHLNKSKEDLKILTRDLKVLSEIQRKIKKQKGG